MEIEAKRQRQREMERNRELWAVKELVQAIGNVHKVQLQKQYISLWMKL